MEYHSNDSKKIISFLHRHEIFNKSLGGGHNERHKPLNSHDVINHLIPMTS